VWNLVSYLEGRILTAFEKLLRIIVGSKKKGERTMEEIS
jgi:hypothetical protein